MRLQARIKPSHICTPIKWMRNLQATPLEDYQHRKPAHNMSTKKAHEYPMCSFTQRALQVYRTDCVTSRLTKRPQGRRRASNVLPHATGASSLHHQLVSSGPFQGQQLLTCVRATIAENSGVSAWVSRTFDNPHLPFTYSPHLYYYSTCFLTPLCFA
jgi:hypothetical protein